MKIAEKEQKIGNAFFGAERRCFQKKRIPVFLSFYDSIEILKFRSRDVTRKKVSRRFRKGGSFSIVSISSLSNAYLVTKFGVDTAENEPFKVLRSQIS